MYPINNTTIGIEQPSLGYFSQLFVDGVEITSNGSPAFGIIAVSGEDNIVADTPSDTLELIAGTDISIVNDALNKSTTIALNTLSGSYSPIFTSVFNIAAVSAVGSALYYNQVKNVVTVWGRVNIQPTAASFARVRVSIPVPSNFSSSAQAGGSGVTARSATLFGGFYVIADTINDELEFGIQPPAGITSSESYSFTCTYLVN